MIRQVLSLLSVALLLAAASAYWVKPSWTDPEVTLFEAIDLQPIWVDARPRDQYDQGHIPGALLLNEDEWYAQLPLLLAEFQQDRAVVVYCSSLQCKSSHAVARRLREEADMEVRVLRGGWEAWKGK